MEDASEIASVIGALAVHVDGQDWAPLAELFAAEVRVDYTSLFGGEAQTIGRDQLLAAWRALLPGFTYTHHLIGAPAIGVSADAAQAQASVSARHVMREGDRVRRWDVGGCYDMRLVRQGGRWRIAGLTLARAWQEGDLDLPRIAAERAAAG